MFGAGGRISAGAEVRNPPVLSYTETVLSYSPTAYWRLGEAETNTTAVDEIGSHNGTWQGNGVTQGSTSLLVGDADTATELHGLIAEHMTAATLTTNSTNFNSCSFVIDITQGQLDDNVDLNVVVSAMASGDFYSKYFFSIKNGDFQVIIGTSNGSTYRSYLFTGQVGKSHIYVEWPVDDVVSGELILYIDGVKQTNTSTTGPAAVIAPDGGSLVLGRYSTGFDGHYWAGILDEFAVYPDALSPGEILALYNADI